MKWCLPLLLVGCAPDVCGDVDISATPNEELKNYYADGQYHFAELCGTDYGAFGEDRPDYDMFEMVLDANTPDADFDNDLKISRIVLPAASVAFLNKHFVKGEVMTMANLAGGGLHKDSEPAIYQTYALTAGTIIVLGGPKDREDDTFAGEHHWSELWHLQWDLTYGNGAEHWTGDDWVKRTDGDTIGDPNFIPPDYMATSR